MLTYLQQYLDPWLLFLADDPMLRLLQGCLLLLGFLVVFLVFFTTRDILLRTQSFTYMFLSILLVAALPVVGFFVYLLVRPPRTLKERAIEGMVKELIGRTTKTPKTPRISKKGRSLESSESSEASSSSA